MSTLVIRVVPSEIGELRATEGLLVGVASVLDDVESTEVTVVEFTEGLGARYGTDNVDPYGAEDLLAETSSVVDECGLLAGLELGWLDNEGAGVADKLLVSTASVLDERELPRELELGVPDGGTKGLAVELGVAEDLLVGPTSVLDE